MSKSACSRKDAYGRENCCRVAGDVLVDAGVKRAYGVAGDSLNGITDSMRTRNEIRSRDVSHRKAANLARQYRALKVLVENRNQAIRRRTYDR